MIPGDPNENTFIRAFTDAVIDNKHEIMNAKKTPFAHYDWVKFTYRGIKYNVTVDLTTNKAVEVDSSMRGYLNQKGSKIFKADSESIKKLKLGDLLSSRKDLLSSRKDLLSSQAKVTSSQKVNSFFYDYVDVNPQRRSCDVKQFDGQGARLLARQLASNIKNDKPCQVPAKTGHYSSTSGKNDNSEESGKNDNSADEYLTMSSSVRSSVRSSVSPSVRSWVFKNIKSSASMSELEPLFSELNLAERQSAGKDLSPAKPDDETNSVQDPLKLNRGQKTNPSSDKSDSLKNGRRAGK